MRAISLKRKSLLIFCPSILLSLFLVSCATPPSNIENACAILAEKKWFFSSWASALEESERQYHIPAHVILAIIHVESSFKPYAKPRRRKLLGFIPWKRLSSAYGYAQALDGTWAHYQKITHRPNASRTNFADSVLFIGWFLDQSARRHQLNREDTYHLYLTYYFGHNGYESVQQILTPAIDKAAKRAAKIARTYKQQLRQCYRQSIFPADRVPLYPILPKPKPFRTNKDLTVEDIIVG